MPPLVPTLLLSIPALALPPPPPHPPHHRLPRRTCFLRAPLAASSSSSSSPSPSRQPYYRRRRNVPNQATAPAPAQARRPSPQQQQRPRPANAGARGQEDLEAAIYDFMCRSDKPGAFPTREELLAAGRADLAAAVASSGSWLSLGWSPAGAAAEGPATPAAPRSTGGGHPDYPPETGAYYRGDLAPGSADGSGSGSGSDSEWEEADEEASPSGRQPETEETREVRFKAGIEGMLTRLQRDRERARPLPRSSSGTEGRSDNGAGNSGGPNRTGAGGMHTPRVPENGSVHGSDSQNGTLGGNGTLWSSRNDAWKTWSLDKGGLSDFEAAEVLPTDSRKLSRRDELDIALLENDIHRPSNGVAVRDYPSDDIDTERDEIHSRLQNLELDLSAALKTLRSRFDKVLSDMSNGYGASVLDDISDDWEFEETKVMQAQEELRSIRAKIAVLEGKMALEIIERNKIIEDKQRRLDEVEKALSELRTVCIMWASPASEVLLVGSFDGWTSRRKLERLESGMFSLNLRLYPGRYEIKFIVDGVWKNDPLRPTVHNNGHENNLLESLQSGLALQRKTGREALELNISVDQLVAGPLEPVPPGADDEVDEVEDADSGDCPVEEVEAALVEVLRQPVLPGPRRPVHDGHQEAAEVVAEGEVAEGQRPRHAPHVLRDFLVVELDLADEVERLGQSQDHELRHHPQAGHGRDGPAGDGGAERGLAERDGAAPVLDDGRDDHGDGGERDADALALEQREPFLLSRHLPELGQQEAVVERDPERLREHGEDGEGRGGDLEPAAAEPAVGLQRGQHHVRGLLHHGDVVDDPRGPDGHDADEALDLLHLLHAAEPPWVGGRGSPLAHLLGRRHDGRLVQAAELVRVRELGDDGAGVRRVEEVLLRVLGLLQRPLLERGRQHLHDAGEGAALGRDPHVEARAHEEEHAGQEHERRGDAQPDGPAHVALHVDDDGGRQHHGGGEGEYQLKKLLMPRLPDSVLGSNWSAPKGMLQGRIPAEPSTRNAKAMKSTANWYELAFSHVSPTLHSGGCRLSAPAVSVSRNMPWSMMHIHGGADK
ncbi:LOW QUALITY PROTEIN: hypothetical protein U9M48_010181 [Paspalum notatum var. saurae]|uniref:AMP-activated protein kinase glycogen-binding domain-containing protein n=1 Tax=Paspalum notatum var. saurae TaxID=547442 RepID=A0AAQ3SSV8_PASNO